MIKALKRYDVKIIISSVVHCPKDADYKIREHCDLWKGYDYVVYYVETDRLDNVRLIIRVCIE